MAGTPVRALFVNADLPRDIAGHFTAFGRMTDHDRISEVEHFPHDGEVVGGISAVFKPPALVKDARAIRGRQQVSKFWPEGTNEPSTALSAPPFRKSFVTAPNGKIERG
jgi:hypothetical protein